MSNAYIEVKNVSKRFRRNMTNFRAILEYILRIPSPDDFWGLDDVSFSVKPGESLGIIGANGAGKSTLLKMMAGILSPTKGTVVVKGRIGALIEVGAGFHPELTGRENVFLYGSILGMPRKEIEDKFDAIVEFSGLGAMLDTPVKFYSSGMYLRLGFAVTAHMDPDILIVDEAMAVGDAEFQTKCLEKIEEFRRAGKIIIVVSHDLSLIEKYTKRCLFLQKGKVVCDAAPKECIRQYIENSAQVIEEHTAIFPDSDAEHYIKEVSLYENTIPTSLFEPQTTFQLRTSIAHKSKDASPLLFGFGIFREGKYLFGSKHVFVPKETNTELTLNVPQHPFLAGSYVVAMGVWQKSTDDQPFDFHNPAISFVVKSSETTKQYDGFIVVPHSFT